MLFQASKSPGLSVFRRGGLKNQQTATTKTPDGKLRASDIRVAHSAVTAAVVDIAFILTFIECIKYSTFPAGLSRVFSDFKIFSTLLWKKV